MRACKTKNENNLMDLTLKIFIEIIVQKVMVLSKLIRVKENKQYSSLRDWFQTEPIKNEEGYEIEPNSISF